MNRYMALLTAILAIGLSAVACGGDDKTIDLGDGNSISAGDDLPDDWPDDFPVYDGADFQGALTTNTDEGDGTSASWTTGDDYDEVRSFYENELDQGPWKASGTISSTSDFTTWNVTKDGDDRAAFLSITQSDGEVLIAVTLVTGALSGDGDPSGNDGDDPTPDEGSGDEDPTAESDSGDGDAPSAELPDEVDLDEDFPSDTVKLPDGARVTSSSSFSGSGIETHVLEVYVDDSVEDVAQFFEDELPNEGYAQTFTSTTDGEVFASYGPEGGTGQESVLLVISDSDVEGYTLVNLTVSRPQQ